MALRAFREIPKNLVEWGRYFASLTVQADEVPPEAIEDGSLGFEKLQNVTPDRLLGRDTSPAGVIQELTVTGGLEFTGSGIRRSALTGDIVAAAGDSATVFRDGAANSVLGRDTSTPGAIADIVAGSDSHFLRRSAGVLGFGAIADSDLPSTIARDTEVTAAIAAALAAYAPSGTYTPTLTNTLNIGASVAYQCHWLRAGNTVFVSGKVDIDPTAVGAVDMGMSLPVASNFGGAEDCGGVGHCTAVQQGAAILADATNDRARWVFDANDTANRSFYFSFGYEVI